MDKAAGDDIGSRNDDGGHPPVANALGLLTDLRDAIGADQVLTEGDLSAWEFDWRRRWRGRALAVVRPATSAEVATVVRLCAHHGATLVAQGGNTGLVGGGVPDDSGNQIVLSLTRLNKVRAIDHANLTMTVEAGCILKAVQDSAEEAGLWFPLSLAAEGSCTIGGNLATNAGGTQVLRFGNAREQCLGLEVVTAAGEVWNGLSGLRKDNTGYDLRDLFIGSEGTLGVITAATLKLQPRALANVTAFAACDSPVECVALLDLARARLGSGLTGFEVMGQFSLELVRRHFAQLVQPLPPCPWSVLIEYASSETQEGAKVRVDALLETALDQGLITDAAVAASVAQSRNLWHLRESIPLAQSLEGLNIKHDISLPVSVIPDFIRQTDAALAGRWPGVRMVDFGHLGDGNLHYNVQAPAGTDPAAFLADCEAAVNAVVYDAVCQRGGSISAEHGIGQLKRDELRERASPVKLALMKSIKNALDPHNRLNPGRVI